jgi:anaerobic selenocysteine-containing dehydrogenase
LRSEPAIVAGIAMATLPQSTVSWQALVAEYDLIRDGIEAVFPEFEKFNERVRVPGGFRLPLPATEHIWNTPSKKAEFIPFYGLNEAPHIKDRNVLKMTTVRSHDQYNTTVYGLDDRYRGVFGRRDVVFMNEEDLTERGIEHGDIISIETALDTDRPRQLTGFTAIAHKIAKGSIAAYYPEANVLVPLDYCDKECGTPSYKSVPVKIKRLPR